MAALTLHEAMAVILRGRGWMDRDELARELADRELYRRRKDGLSPPSYQLGMRVRRYPHWFRARGPGGAQVRLVRGGPGETTTSGEAHRSRAVKPRAAGPPRTRHAGSRSSHEDTKRIRNRRAAAARKYRPQSIGTLLVAEAPPAAPDRYFYFEDVRAHDSLFRNVAKLVLGGTPSRDEKAGALKELQRRGYFLVDLRQDPIDRSPLAAHVPSLITRARRLAPVRVILIKATVYDAAFRALRDAGLPVIDERIPFPGSGQQVRFARCFERALKARPRVAVKDRGPTHGLRGVSRRA